MSQTWCVSLLLNDASLSCRCVFLSTLFIYFEYQMEPAGDRCTLSLLGIHSSSCRLLEACCPNSRPVGWNRRDTKSLFERGEEIKLLEFQRAVNSSVHCTPIHCIVGRKPLWHLYVKDSFKTNTTVCSDKMCCCTTYKQIIRLREKCTFVSVVWN